jgi:hypothetical protein
LQAHRHPLKSVYKLLWRFQASGKGLARGWGALLLELLSKGEGRYEKNGATPGRFLSACFFQSQPYLQALRYTIDMEKLARERILARYRCLISFMEFALLYPQPKLNPSRGGGGKLRVSSRMSR